MNILVVILFMVVRKLPPDPAFKMRDVTNKVGHNLFFRLLVH